MSEYLIEETLSLWEHKLYQDSGKTASVWNMKWASEQVQLLDYKLRDHQVLKDIKLLRFKCIVLFELLQMQV